MDLKVWTDMAMVLTHMIKKGSQCMHSLFKFLSIDWSLLHDNFQLGMCGRVLLMSNFISLLFTKPKLLYKALPFADAWSTTLVH